MIRTGYESAAVLYLIYAGVIVASIVLERCFPYRPPEAGARVVLNDMVYLFLRWLLAPVRVLVYAWLTLALTHFVADQGWSGFCASWPYWARLATAFLVLRLRLDTALQRLLSAII